MLPNPTFLGDEFENYLILAWRMGLVDRSGYSEVEWKSGANKSSYKVEDEIVRLTPAGWDYMSEFDRPLLHRWWGNIVENVPTIILSVLTALLVGWIVYWFGAPR